MTDDLFYGVVALTVLPPAFEKVANASLACWSRVRAAAGHRLLIQHRVRDVGRNRQAPEPGQPPLYLLRLAFRRMGRSLLQGPDRRPVPLRIRQLSDCAVVVWP
jgi:hypothetical protein